VTAEKELLNSIGQGIEAKLRNAVKALGGLLNVLDQDSQLIALFQLHTGK